MARRKAKRKASSRSRKRRSGGSRFVLKSEGTCVCKTPRAATLGPLKRRMAALCRKDPRSYIVDSKATTAAGRIVARCGG
jgi:hypothetical protein